MSAQHEAWQKLAGRIWSEQYIFNQGQNMP